MLDPIFSFADHARYAWIRDEARSLPAGSRDLDGGAGGCRYRRLFDHCAYQAQDFCAHEPVADGPLNEVGSWRYGKIDYVCDAGAIPVPDGSFDAVICTEVLEHVPDPVAVVREIGRILRPGGKLILSAPLGSGIHQEPDHYYGGFTPYRYERFLTEAGFRNVVATPNGGFFKHYGQESRRFSALLDPRRVKPRLAAVALLPVWVMSVPLMRVVIPLLCHAVDRLDRHRGFTVGYHVTAIRGATA